MVIYMYPKYKCCACPLSVLYITSYTSSHIWEQFDVYMSRSFSTYIFFAVSTLCKCSWIDPHCRAWKTDYREHRDSMAAEEQRIQRIVRQTVSSEITATSGNRSIRTRFEIMYNHQFGRVQQRCVHKLLLKYLFNLTLYLIFWHNFWKTST